jgi:hypothetical protein
LFHMVKCQMKLWKKLWSRCADDYANDYEDGLMKMILTCLKVTIAFEDYGLRKIGIKK